MINYSKSQLYIIKRQDTDEVIFAGGTVSNLKRRYWNHKCNENDPFNRKVKAENLDWRHLKIEASKNMNLVKIGRPYVLQVKQPICILRKIIMKY